MSGALQQVTFDSCQRRKDGTTYDATIKVWKLQTDNGEVMVESVVDHSDHDALGSLLSTAIDSFPGGFCALDANLKLTMANRKLYELLDLPEDRFPVGCAFPDILRFYAERGDYGDVDVEDMVRKRIDYLKLYVEHTFEREASQGSFVEVRLAPLPVGGCVITYHDVTERRRAQMELLRRRDDLECAVQERTAEIERQSDELERALAHERRINELQRQFVAMTSHEFRTPLAIIDGSAQRLLRQRGELTADCLRDRVGRIRSSVTRMVDLMDSILAADRLEEGKIEIELADCDLGKELSVCCDRQNELARKHRITCVHSGLNGTIRADRSALEQVFTNLLSNAVKYSPDGGNVTVTAWRENGDVCVSFQDNGLGIDEDDLPKMFGRYFRARTSSGVAGTGIGLNLVKQIVELHGGTIAVLSRKGEGSTFTVRMPVAGNIEEEETPEPALSGIQAA